MKVWSLYLILICISLVTNTVEYFLNVLYPLRFLVLQSVILCVLCSLSYWSFSVSCLICMRSFYLKNSNPWKCVFSADIFLKCWCDFEVWYFWDWEGFSFYFTKFINIFMISWTAVTFSLSLGIEKHSTRFSPSFPYFHSLDIQLFNPSWNYLSVWYEVKSNGLFPPIIKHLYQHDLLSTLLTKIL